MPEARLLHLHPAPGERLRDLLLAAGMEFPCGGEGTCGQCRVRVSEGELPAPATMRESLTDEEIRQGWRLGCLAEAQGPLTLEVAQWHPDAISGAQILSDSVLVAVEPREGVGAVVDLGTTSLVVQAVDLTTGEVLATETAINPQVPWGADLMTRIRHELEHPGELRVVIRRNLGEMLAQVNGGRELREVLIVGNAVMHHLFCGFPVEHLACAPFRTPYLDAATFSGLDLGWEFRVDEGVCFLPNLGGFVGSDILAGLAATGLGAFHGEPEALLDLGTNGEIAVAAGGRLLCASTAAGPAFEAGNIRHGMRAAAGAIHRVDFASGVFLPEVFGGGAARGICGSGLVDAIACGLDAGMVLPAGRLRAGIESLRLSNGVEVTQKDIRELQLAKAAIASGLELLEELAQAQVHRLHLAGAFGNYLRPSSARRIGLLPSERSGAGCAVLPAGNAALRGARMLLLAPWGRATRLQQLRERTTHVELAAHPRFQDAFVDALLFPG